MSRRPVKFEYVEMQIMFESCGAKKSHEISYTV